MLRNRSRRFWILVSLLILVLAIAAFASQGKAAQSPAPVIVAHPTVQSTPDSAIVWQDGALRVFHSSDTLNAGGYTGAFTAPAVWRLKWFCQPGTDPSQAFLGINVQQAGDLTDAPGSTPLQANCEQQQNGFLIEHVGGSVTLKVLAGTGTSWDVYVQV